MGPDQGRPAARLLVAEDEAPMREHLLAQLAQQWPEAEVVAVAENGLDAWDAFLEHEPDVVFTDIRMPGMSGLDLATRIAGFVPDGERAPRLVFVTAYDQHAVDAFERGALDYLLKPVEPQRLARCVRRLAQQVGADEAAAPGLAALRERAAEVQRLRWIKATVGRRIQLIAIDEVLFFQSDSKYTRVVHREGEALIRTPLKELLGGLDPEQFWQVHRSAVVNARAVAGAERLDADRMEVLIRGSEERLPVSRAFMHWFRD
ncbi:LytTR family DNA-binding domain-containing protein [Pelomonas sp. CA6]|uniref:LytR/AlgR family response regulator transcription factor n=1 Tax=Pelomonas sp. CA6 TaxID=2907999 RepID=UPI001F4BD749|nr:LytTR family DNA-binding domain-containing protein [Pelomonas sp. CA6]MCH7343538.1 LytTR family DNA-binding domain-containing protein [Pelomonas sp. CA6]